MPQGSKILGKPIDEKKWAEAKKLASDEGHAGDYAYIMGIYKKMSHVGEFEKRNIKDRKKNGMTLPEWKEKKWDPKNRRLKKPVRKALDSAENVRLMLIPDSDLEEFRCGKCNALLFKGIHLEKSLIEVKCRSCGTLLASPGMLVL